MDEFDGGHDYRPTSLYAGVVTDVADPLKVGRVRVRIPGVLATSAWALPLNVGGGSELRGFYFVPEVGAEVGVLFHQGDVDHPYYIPACWRAPRGGSQLNERVTGKAPSEAPKVRVIETERFVVIFDDTAETPAMILRCKATGDGIEYDARTRAMTVLSTASLSIRSVGTVAIEGLNVTINGRPVRPSGEPI